MGETFESDEYEDGEDFDGVEDSYQPPPRRGRKRVEDVPDAPVENAADIPLLAHAGTGKANTVTYLKVTRLDGPRGVRGLKGKLPPESTYEDVARRYGNGTYKIEGCSQRHKVLAREEGLEIAIPGFDEDEGRAGNNPVPVSGPSPQFALHGMKMISDMSGKHQEVVSQQAQAQVDATRQLSSTTMDMITNFTQAQRESERNAFTQMQANMQQFFASMMALQNTAHAQQMELLQAHTRNNGADEGNQLETFIAGLKLAMEMNGGADMEPWLAALKEGTGALGHLATLAKAGPTRGEVPTLPGRPAALPSTNVQRNPRPEGQKRKKRLPFKKNEIRGIAKLRAELRRRGIPLEDFLEQTTDYYQQAPDSEIFAGDDGPVESEDHAAESASDAIAPEATRSEPSD